MSINYHTPLLGFVAYSGTGKTTLLEQLIPRLIDRGYRIGLIKHGHHEFDIDTPGKDSYRLRKAGASRVMVASAQRWALINENSTVAEEPDLAILLRQFDDSDIDLLLVEGFKHQHYPKIELRRYDLDRPPFYPADDAIVAIACDFHDHLAAAIPVLDLNNLDSLADFVVQQIIHHKS